MPTHLVAKYFSEKILQYHSLSRASKGVRDSPKPLLKRESSLQSDCPRRTASIRWRSDYLFANVPVFAVK